MSAKQHPNKIMVVDVLDETALVIYERDPPLEMGNAVLAGLDMVQLLPHGNIMGQLG